MKIIFLDIDGVLNMADAARQPLPWRGVLNKEPEMPKDHPSLVFFALIATSLCAAVVLVALLIAGDVRRSKSSNEQTLPPHSQAR